MAEKPHPTITVIEDIDPTPGYGAWWGEVHTNMHKGLGSLGVITNGSVRDLPQCAPGFQMLAGNIGPAHAFNHCVEWGIPVTVAGMRVHPGDLIHADQHGAVVVPAHLARAVPEAAARLAREEAVMIKASQQADFSCEVIERLLTGSPH
jgi:regulator of RNase E activity RraA